MKRLLIAIALCLFAGSAYAACTPPLAVKDGAGNSVNMSVVQGADGSCQYYIDIDASSRFYQALTAAIPAGTNLIGDVNLRQGSSALSTTNGAYFNQLQGNAVLSATNPSFTRPTDGTNAAVFDPCQVVAKSYKAFSQTATSVLVTGAASKKTYVCSISIIAGAAEIFNLTAGTGSTCGTSTVAVMGSTTAANGLSLAANGGLTFGNGAASLAATTVNQDDLCLQQNSTSRLSGSITYVQL